MRWCLALILIATIGLATLIKGEEYQTIALDWWNEHIVTSRDPITIDTSDPILVDSVAAWANSGVSKPVNKELMQQIVILAFSESQNQKIDPLLTLAVIKVESNFDYMAASKTSNASGLMQIIPYWHKDKITVAQVFDPTANIRAGTKALRDYLGNHGGDVNKALKNYNGSLGVIGSNYDDKVLAARADLSKYVERSIVQNLRQTRTKQTIKL
jgi:soluble lytic murein transglycosylase-like protein